MRSMQWQLGILGTMGGQVFRKQPKLGSGKHLVLGPRVRQTEKRTETLIKTME